MKCPKCGYISFDYNSACPKCNKDITAERQKMGLPSYKPSTPSMLGALTGEANESHIGLEAHRPAETAELEQEIGGLSFEDSQAIEAMEVAFEDSQDLEIEFEPVTDNEPADSIEEIEFSDLEQETEEDVSKEKGAEELSLDLENLPFDNGEVEQSKEAGEDEFIMEPDSGFSSESENEKPSEDLFVNLEDLGLEEDLPDKNQDTPSLELEGLFDETDKTPDSYAGTEEQNDQIILDLGDLEEDSTENIELKPGTNDAEEEMDLEILDLDLDIDEPETKPS